jgi:hypothetical protein
VYTLNWWLKARCAGVAGIGEKAIDLVADGGFDVEDDGCMPCSTATT